MLHLHMLIRQFSCSKILILGQNPSFWQHWISDYLHHNLTVELYDVSVSLQTEKISNDSL